MYEHRHDWTNGLLSRISSAPEAGGVALRDGAVSNIVALLLQFLYCYPKSILLYDALLGVTLTGNKQQLTS